MARTLLICGHGPGISDAVARKFGAQGFAVALVARNAERLAASAAALGDAGIRAQGFACDLGDPTAITQLVADVRAQLGPITVLHWNAYTGGAGDLLSCDLAELRKVFDVGVLGPVAAVQAALPDLRTQDNAAVLVTGGGFALYAEQVDKMVVQWNTMGLAVSKAAQHKLTHLLHHKLAGEGIYVGEVMVMGMVKGTAFDPGNATLEPAKVAGEFWRIYEGRSELSVSVS
jgi:NAD(P)-dependent dehydrogenase (short-subunit alcohol dehydrogenase family)